MLFKCILLLYKNVKNLISFTGTAYISLPEDLDIKYNGNPINYGQINEFSTIEESIKFIIDNKTEKIVKNNSQELINDIFICISNYDVLIDIGAIFINLSNNDFFERYKKVNSNKKYFVYFENSSKILNIETGKYESKLSIIDNNAFYYFSNKNITGVDFKDIMCSKAKGLVTITNKTILRDFSQGIFRMRNILDGKQKIDIIIDNKMIENNNEIMIGGSCQNFTNISSSLFNVLKENQRSLDKQKEKMLCKQNILGLLKENSTSSDILLYIDPSNDEIKLTNKLYDKIKKKIKKNNWTEFNNLILNDINLVTKIKNLNFNDKKKLLNSKIIKLLKKYFQYEENIYINTINKSIQLEKSENINKQKINFENINNIFLEKINLVILANLSGNIDMYNGIIFCADCEKNYMNYFILYHKKKKSIYVFNYKIFIRFLLYNQIDDFYDKFVLISLLNDSFYGKKITNEEYKYYEYLKIIIINFIRNNIDDFKYSFTSKQLKILSEENEIIKKIYETFKFCYWNDTTHYAHKNKYLKYKKKYLLLQKSLK